MDKFQREKRKDILENPRTHSGEQTGDSHIGPIGAQSPGSPGMRVLSRYSVTVKNLMKAVGLE